MLELEEEIDVLRDAIFDKSRTSPPDYDLFFLQASGNLDRNIVEIFFKHLEYAPDHRESAYVLGIINGIHLDFEGQFRSNIAKKLGAIVGSLELYLKASGDEELVQLVELADKKLRAYLEHEKIRVRVRETMTPLSNEKKELIRLLDFGIPSWESAGPAYGKAKEVLDTVVVGIFSQHLKFGLSKKDEQLFLDVVRRLHRRVVDAYPKYLRYTSMADTLGESMSNEATTKNFEHVLQAHAKAYEGTAMTEAAVALLAKAERETGDSANE